MVVDDGGGGVGAAKTPVPRSNCQLRQWKVGWTKNREKIAKPASKRKWLLNGHCCWLNPFWPRSIWSHATLTHVARITFMPNQRWVLFDVLSTHSRDFKYIGNPTWPNLQDAQYNCVFQLSLDITSGLEAIVLQFPDFQTDCTQRSRVWITEYGKQQAFHYCGRNAINNYI